MRLKPKADQENLCGINIQWPWSELIISGKKTIETRSYPLPKNKTGIPIALIETPGPRGKKEAGIEKARIIGVIEFLACKQYKTAAAWKKDFDHHQVPLDDPQFHFDAKKEKWGWQLKILRKFSSPKPAPKKRGIVWARFSY